LAAKNSRAEDPLVAAATVIGDLTAIKCRQGYYNTSVDFTDAINYCTGLNKNDATYTKRVFSQYKVAFGGPTPLLV
jgi:hypothetical protein